MAYTRGVLRMSEPFAATLLYQRNTGLSEVVSHYQARCMINMVLPISGIDFDKLEAMRKEAIALIN